MVSIWYMYVILLVDNKISRQCKYIIVVTMWQSIHACKLSLESNLCFLYLSVQRVVLSDLSFFLLPLPAPTTCSSPCVLLGLLLKKAHKSAWTVHT